MRKISAWLPAVVWALLIFIASSQSKVNVAESFWINFVIFKSLHILEYAILYMFCYRGFAHLFSNKTKKALLYSFFLVMVYAFTDELHQQFIPTRDSRYRDILFDGIGAFFAYFLLFTNSIIRTCLEKILL